MRFPAVVETAHGPERIAFDMDGGSSSWRAIKTRGGFTVAGTVADGTVTDATVADGTVADGTVADGRRWDRMPHRHAGIVARNHRRLVNA